MQYRPPEPGEPIRSPFLKELAENTKQTLSLNSSQGNFSGTPTNSPLLRSKWVVVDADFTETDEDPLVFSGGCLPYRIDHSTGEFITRRGQEYYTVFKHIGVTGIVPLGVDPIGKGPSSNEILFIFWNKDASRWETTDISEKNLIVKPIRDVEPGTVGRCDIYRGPIGLESATGETILGYSHGLLLEAEKRCIAEHFTNVCGGKPRPLNSSEVSSEFDSSLESSDYLGAVAPYELFLADGC